MFSIVFIPILLYSIESDLNNQAEDKDKENLVAIPGYGLIDKIMLDDDTRYEGDPLPADLWPVEPWSLIDTGVFMADIARPFRDVTNEALLRLAIAASAAAHFSKVRIIRRASALAAVACAIEFACRSGRIRDVVRVQVARALDS